VKLGSLHESFPSRTPPCVRFCATDASFAAARGVRCERPEKPVYEKMHTERVLDEVSQCGPWRRAERRGRALRAAWGRACVHVRSVVTRRSCTARPWEAPSLRERTRSGSVSARHRSFGLRAPTAAVAAAMRPRGSLWPARRSLGASRPRRLLRRSPTARRKLTARGGWTPRSGGRVGQPMTASDLSDTSS
jgi:hypothetical protein